MSPAGALKRALVTLLLSLARQFEITLSVSRDSPDDPIKKAFRKVILRVHPDRPGGSVEHTKKVNDHVDGDNTVDVRGFVSIFNI